MRGKATLLLCAFLAFGATAAHANIDKAGTTAANFLTVGAGADVLSMGGATLGFGSSLNSASWNAAALGGLHSTEYVFSHASLPGENPQEWIAAGGRFGLAPTRWGVTGLYQGDGTFEGRDALNNPTGSFTASSMAIGLQLAQPLGRFASVGAGAKYVREQLGDVSGGGVTFDFGMRMQAGPLGFGAAAQNALGKMGYNGVLYDFPTNYGVGVAYSMPITGVTFALDANFPTSYYSDVRGGVEWRWHDRLALRTGYRKEVGSADGEPLGGPTFGMGAGANGFWFDYGYLVGGASGSGQHRMQLTYHPGFMNGDMAESEPNTAPKESTPKAPKAPKTVEKPAKTAAVEAPKTESAKAVLPLASTTKAGKAPKPGSYAAAVRAAELEAAAQRQAASAPATAAPSVAATAAPSAAATAPATTTPAATAPATTTPAATAPATTAPATAAPATTAPAMTTAAKPATSVAVPSTAAPAAVATGAAPAASTSGAKTASNASTTSVAPERTAPMAKVSPPASASTANQAPAPTNVTTKASAPRAAASVSAPVGAGAVKTPSAPAAASAKVSSAAKAPAATAAKTPSAPATTGAAPAVAPATAAAKSSSGEAPKTESAKIETPPAAKPAEANAQSSEPPKSEQVAAVVPTSAPATPAAAPTPAAEQPAPPAAAPATAKAPAPRVAPKKAEEPAAPSGPRPEKAKLKSGETLADFAKRWNTTAAAIMMTNNLVSEKVKPGTTLKLPPANR